MLTHADVEAAQQSWGQGLVAIGAAETHEKAHALAEAFVREHYLLEDGTLLFCPTRAAVSQFRSTLEDAVSYFVGGNPKHEEDHGFALDAWSSVRFENTGVVLKGGLAIAMGNYFFGKPDGSEQKVEYSFVYVRSEDGSVRIQLHHSALVYGS